jgi:hypothetical protein
LIIWISAYAQQQVRGRVINRSGIPQAGCLIEFFSNPNEPPTYSIKSDNDGWFYLNNPRQAKYTVSVRQGQQQYSVTATIDDRGLHPSTLVVSW